MDLAPARVPRVPPSRARVLQARAGRDQARVGRDQRDQVRAERDQRDQARVGRDGDIMMEKITVTTDITMHLGEQERR